MYILEVVKIRMEYEIYMESCDKNEDSLVYCIRLNNVEIVLLLRTK
jgi:hypothetical protein